MLGLEGKTFIIAGGATGIGAGTAKRLAAEGASVVVGDVNMVGAKATVETITASGGSAIAVEFDLADDESVRDLIDATIAEFGAVHGLDNVGADLSEHNLGRDTTILDTPFEVWHRTLDVNLLGFVRTIRAVLPHLLEHGGGSIVNTSSGGSLGTDPMHVAYNASKAAVNQLTRHVANNYGAQGIRSNAVMPGLVMGETQERQNDQQIQRMFLMAAKVTRLGKPADLAAVTAFLLSDDAEWINGQTWYIGGASHMRQ
ncbi:MULTISPECIES: SDR family NAD(P)-dependent oxidoreductase [unclassified Mycolicibacterium]|uniref:SDR family NAD(P)-dependent oxidoreductase n=1 Tax=unclassified Mycolicibacterium TaxID=2636767 RepID=UPI0012DEEB89|nr:MULTISPECIES: SDR family oxidoreductase [unclassified Mycolicibacterium]MUL85398.1 SDR family oxidoreductase [Mycolicibacterium sp. CBMA 329]MUL88838.1 SDR family oxidoreductase [Mycolicibacterium sp. CBMA 331]MUM01888.1 SDR family oxidoreductase [Mycolicibacterium sp. CBMA 334]MUM27615.1 SDR family oxidoreductase [Mycolicibacterium sp. CBMA 295]MUM40485.1 SDR family oxidoreductase [Mycolicibacterium sp. CBMA 247]